MNLSRCAALAWLLVLAVAVPARGEALSPGTGPKYAIAMTGKPALPPGFARFPYTAPNPPQGGSLVIGALGSFDTFNPFTIRGTADDRLRSSEFLFESYVFESLMVRSRDEPFTLYGLLAKTIETPDDRSWVTFTLDPKARFSDGTPVTPADVIFSWKTLREQGRPNHRSYYSKVARADVIGARSVRFVFKDKGDRELPLILGLMPILPKHVYERRDFQKVTTSELPVGTGPYVVAGFEPGRYILFRKNPHYWAADNPARAGFFNFGTVRVDYYRDLSSMFQAFKAGHIDFWLEQDPARWANNFNFAAVKQGKIERRAIPHGRPSGMLGLVFNTRRPVFADERVRRALILPFDFDWLNRNFFHRAYTRTLSFFDNSDLAAKGPASPTERALLQPYLAEVDPQILAHGWQPPADGTPAADRANDLRALAILKDAGYVMRNGVLVDAKSGKPLAFEIMVDTSEQERVALAYRESLARLGIAVQVRRVDSTQEEMRLDSYDFDATIFHWGGTLSPGNEEAFRWSSAMADTRGSYNLAGVKSAGVDAMIGDITSAQTRQQMIAATRALDRLLLSGRYVLPLYHKSVDFAAWWRKLARPQRQPLSGIDLDTWWHRKAD
jgi:peptide/nickel transport system substrate-binding protein